MNSDTVEIEFRIFETKFNLKISIKSDNLIERETLLAIKYDKKVKIMKHFYNVFSLLI